MDEVKKDVSSSPPKRQLGFWSEVLRLMEHYPTPEEKLDPIEITPKMVESYPYIIHDLWIRRHGKVIRGTVQRARRFKPIQIKEGYSAKCKPLLFAIHQAYP